MVCNYLLSSYLSLYMGSRETSGCPQIKSIFLAGKHGMGNCNFWHLCGYHKGLNCIFIVYHTERP